MPLPVGVETRTVRLLVPDDVLGNPAEVFSGTVMPDRPLIWAATGARLWPVGAQLPKAVAGVVEFEVPIVDQAGWVDAVTGAPVTNFAYRLRVTGSWAVSRRTHVVDFQVFDATADPFELDLAPSGPLVSPPSVPPFVSSLVGLSGAITGEQLADLNNPLGAALGKLRGGMLAYAENATAQVTTATAGGIVITGCTIRVPPTDADVWLHWGGSFGITVGGQGILSIGPYDFTDWPNSFEAVAAESYACLTSQPITQFGPTLSGAFMVGPSDTERIYSLGTYRYRDGADSLLDGFVRNASSLFKSWIGARY